MINAWFTTHFSYSLNNQLTMSLRIMLDIMFIYLTLWHYYAYSIQRRCVKFLFQIWSKFFRKISLWVLIYRSPSHELMYNYLMTCWKETYNEKHQYCNFIECIHVNHFETGKTLVCDWSSKLANENTMQVIPRKHFFKIFLNFGSFASKIFEKILLVLSWE